MINKNLIITCVELGVSVATAVGVFKLCLDRANLQKSENIVEDISVKELDIPDFDDEEAEG